MSKQESTPGTHHTLIFDTVITNENNGYHPFTGTFIVPKIGIYVFTFSIRLACQSFGPYEIVKNTEVVGVVYSDISRVCIADHIAGTIVIHANHGDEIYVWMLPVSTVELFSVTNREGRPLLDGGFHTKYSK